MSPLTLEQVRVAVNGTALGALSEEPQILAICTDTRAITRDCLFVALRGERFDGHGFLAQAADAGAIAAIVEKLPTPVDARLAYIQVSDTRIALGHLARFVRARFRGKVIAVAGSNGKTSTKLLIDSVLRTRLTGSASPKSFNNDIGVPLTIFPAHPLNDYLVLEIGTNHPGEIAPLADMARPDIAVITNCTAEHLEGLGDLDGVRRENVAIVDYLNPAGTLIVLGDDPDLLDAVAHFPGRRITFGTGAQNDLFATDIALMSTGTRFRLNDGLRVNVPILGAHAALNSLAAIAVGRAMHLSDEAIYEGLAGAQAADMRLQLQTIGGVSILNDAYNANPASMEAALALLAALNCTGRRIAILGDMRELGDASERYHAQIGQSVARTEPSLLVCVGPLARIIAQSARQAGYPAERVLLFDNATSASVVCEQWTEGDLVLLKGSRAIRLEKILDAWNLHRAAHLALGGTGRTEDRR